MYTRHFQQIQTCSNLSVGLSLPWPTPRCYPRMCCHPSSPSGPSDPSTDSWSYHHVQAGRATSSRGLPARQRSGAKPTKRMQCAQNRLHRGPVAKVSGPFRTQDSVQPRFLTLPTVTRLIRVPNHTPSSQQALPVLWLECRFCLCSPSTNSNPAGTPLNSAFVQPDSAVHMQECNADGRRNAAGKKRVQSQRRPHVVRINYYYKSSRRTLYGESFAIYDEPLAISICRDKDSRPPSNAIREMWYNMQLSSPLRQHIGFSSNAAPQCKINCRSMGRTLAAAAAIHRPTTAAATKRHPVP
jgi:hypothetical protein